MLRHIPALDGVRAIAVILVIVAHFNSALPIFTGGGTVGVDLFFVLSGFLITSILWGQWLRDRRISLSEFYRRRLLRLWPALALLLLTYCLAAPLISTVPGDHFRAALSAALSYMNWSQALWNGPEGFVGHAWSLSIEEQFYVVWPTALVLMLRYGGRRVACGALLTTLVVGAAWRVHLAWHGAPVIRIYAGTDTHADPLLIGCLAALVTVPKGLQLALARTSLLALAGLLILAMIPAWSTRWFSWEFTANGLLGAWFIVGATDDRLSVLVRALSSRPMVWLGRRSYGIYLWHVMVLKVLTFVGFSTGLRATVGIPVSLLIAAASYRFVEQPFLRLKDRTRPS